MKKLLFTFLLIAYAFSALAQQRPFETTTADLPSSTTWYKVKVNDQFLVVNEYSHEVYCDPRDGSGSNYLWAFIKVDNEKFKIVNLSLGGNYRLYHNGTTGIISYGDRPIMIRDNGHNFRWKQTKRGISGLYVKNMFNTYLSNNRGNVTYEIDPCHVEFFEAYNAEEDAMEQQRMEQERKLIEEEEASRKAAAEARAKAEREKAIREEAALSQKKTNETKSYLVGTWKYSIPYNKITETFYEDGTFKSVTNYSLTEGRQKISYTETVMGIYKVTENGFTVYPDLNKSSLKITTLQGVSAAEAREIRNMFRIENILVTTPIDIDIISRRAAEMVIYNHNSGASNTYTRVGSR